MKEASPLHMDVLEIGAEHAALFARALPYLQTRQNEIHTRISYQHAVRLLPSGGDPDVILPAILLHDVGWSQVPEDLQLSAFGPNVTRPELRDVHEAEGARISAAILADLGYGREAADRIVRIVAEHDSKTTADSVEEAVVKDADKLFRFSAAGLRLLAGWYGLDPRDLLTRLEEKIPSWFLTSRGEGLARDEAAARRAELCPDRESAG